MIDTAASDVFLSYSRADANAVEAVRARLTEAGITSFLDRTKLPAGQAWQPFLEKELGRSGAVAVFVGHRMGSWQHREVQVALDRQAREHEFPVIPVLLPGLDDEPKGFLALQTWIDLRAGIDDPVQLGNLIAAIHREAAEGAAAIKAAICPYRGLLPFREEDAAFFFGRDDWINELTAKVQAHPLVAVVGRSGSGKSSLVFAGLFPALRKSLGGTTWDMLALRPSHEPLNALAEALSPPPEDATPAERIERINADADRLRRGTVRLNQLVRHHLDRQTGTDRLLLYVDQWEELYTLATRAGGGGKAGHDDQATPDIAEAARANPDVTQFIDLLLAAAAEPDSSLTVVLSVRADFYDHLLRHPTLPAVIQGQQLNLGPMTRAQLQKCIEGPATASGLRFEGTLVESILDEVGGDEGKLPLLEYALRETWEASRKAWQSGGTPGVLSFAAYNAIGRVGGAIGTRAEQIYKGLGKAQRQAARRLFVNLVAPGEGQADARAIARVPNDPDIEAVVALFSARDQRLLVTGHDPVRGRIAEVSHEALIRNWGELRGWIDANRQLLLTRDRIAAEMRRWRERGEPDGLLLPPGIRLEEGRELLENHGAVLIDDVRPYIDASIAADLTQQKKNRADEEAERLQEERNRAEKWRLRASASLTVTLLVATLLPAYGYISTVDYNDAIRQFAERGVTIALEENRSHSLIFGNQAKNGSWDALIVDRERKALPPLAKLLSHVTSWLPASITHFLPLTSLITPLRPIVSLTLAHDEDVQELKLSEEFNTLRALQVSDNTKLSAIEFSSDLSTLIILKVSDNPALSALKLPASASSLRDLIVRNNPQLAELGLPDEMRGLQSAQVQNNGKLKMIKMPQDLFELKWLHIRSNPELEMISFPADWFSEPDSSSSKQEPMQLTIRDNPSLLDLEFSNDMSDLQDLHIRNNPSLSRIILPEHLSSLQQLTVADNSRIEDLDLTGRVSALRTLSVTDNERLRTVSGLQQAKELSVLALSGGVAPIKPDTWRWVDELE